MMPPGFTLRISQFLVFALVTAAFTNIYLPQPVLPVLASEFGVDAASASLTVSATVLGIAFANLPFGSLSDRFPLRPIILLGGVCVALAGLFAATTESFSALVAARFVQGLFIPALTTCVAAFLANSLPVERLNVAMGAYVSATVVGGLGGRLLGGFIHPPLHWRYAFVSAAVLLIAATLASAKWLPNVNKTPTHTGNRQGFWKLLAYGPAVRMCLAGFGAFWVFSTTFNFLPFQLSQPPINASTNLITLLYLVYVFGAFIGPISGRMSNRYGTGKTMITGSVILGFSLAGLLVPNLITVVVSLLAVCAGFFTIHAAASGGLNSRLTSGRGKGNALYVLFYYSGGAAGITTSGYAWRFGGWEAVLGLSGLMLAVPLLIGLYELKSSRPLTKPDPSQSP